MSSEAYESDVVISALAIKATHGTSRTMSLHIFLLRIRKLAKVQSDRMPRKMEISDREALGLK